MKRLFCLVLLAFACTACTNITTWKLEKDSDYMSVRPMEFEGNLLLPGGDLLENTEYQTFFRDMRYILVGVSHSAGEDLASALKVLRTMYSYRYDPVLALDVLGPESQNVLNSFNQRKIKAASLEKALDWNRQTGLPFALYSNIFSTCEANNIPVYAVGAPRKTVNEIMLYGMSQVSSRSMANTPVMPASKEQRAHLAPLYSMLEAAGQAPEGKFENYLQAQAYIDTHIADRLVSINRLSMRSVFLIAGESQVYAEQGVALRLQKIDPKADICSIMPWRGAVESLYADVPDLAKASGGLTGATRISEVVSKLDNDDSLLVQGGVASYSAGSPFDSPLTSSLGFGGRRGEQYGIPNAEIAEAYYYSPLNPLAASSEGFIMGMRGHKAEGILVLDVSTMSNAWKFGLRKGDIIIRAAGRYVRTPGDYLKVEGLYRAYKSGIPVEVLRDGKNIELIL